MAADSPYHHLDAASVRDTAASLRARIVARFPERRLGHVADAVRAAAVRAGDAGHRPPLRRLVRAGCTLVAFAVMVGTAVALVIVVRDAVRAADGRQSFDWLPVIESAINDLAFAAIATFFLLTVSQRLDRHAIVSELHRLRSLAHVIDMHQLTKDPERQLSQPEPTEASVEQTMTQAELGRYLDYCSEMLSLVGKIAALYSQESHDPQVLDTVSEIESLTVGLSRKIWQKIALLHAR